MPDTDQVEKSEATPRNIFIPRNWIDNAGDDFANQTEPDQIEYVHIEAHESLKQRVQKLEKALQDTGHYKWTQDKSRKVMCWCDTDLFCKGALSCAAAREALGESQ